MLIEMMEPEALDRTKATDTCGGTINVISQLGQGSVFSFKPPIKLVESLH